MSYKILHRHGNYGPSGKATYIKLGGTFPSEKAAIKYRKKHLLGAEYRYVPSSKAKYMSSKKLYYVKK